MALVPAPGGGDPRSRLIVLVATLGVVVVSMYSCQKYSSPDMSDYPAPHEQVMVLADERASLEQPLKGVRVRETLQIQNIVDFVGEDDAKRFQARNLERIRVAIDEAFGWMKGVPDTEIANQAWARGVWSHAKIMQDPDRWRLKILHVYGMLLHHEIIELSNMPEGLGKLHKLILFDRRNHIGYTVLTPLMPAEAWTVQETREGSYLACDAMFLMRYPYLAEDGWRSTPLLLAKRTYMAREKTNIQPLLDVRTDPGIEYNEIRPDKTAARIDTEFLHEYLYAPPKDGTGARSPMTMDFHDAAADLTQDKPALDHAFEYVYGLSEEDLRAQINPEVSYISLMEGNEPPKWMTGKVTAFKGLASFVKTYEYPNAENGISRIHLIIGHDTRLRGPGFTWALATLNLPEGLRTSDEIEAEGVFLKLYPYPTVEGNWHWAPLIACKEVRRIGAVDAGPPTTAYVIIGIAILALAFAVYYAGLRDTSDLEAVRQRVLARRIEHDKKQAQKRKHNQDDPASPDAPETSEAPDDTSEKTDSGTEDEASPDNPKPDP